jgi:ATP-dependent RNA circularization protein (DNA/RNA ligase family)
MRDPATRHRTFLMGEYADPAFGYLADADWQWTEKIDGTNIRLFWDGQSVTIGGRTDAAQIPAFLLNRLNEIEPSIRAVFDGVDDVLLFGEGYGAKIQKGGGLYKPDGVDFILFDVWIGGMVLERPNVEDVAAKLGIGSVPLVGQGTLHDAVEFVRGGFASRIGTAQAEGIVMRPAVELRTRRGDRVITKLKHKDFT